MLLQLVIFRATTTTSVFLLHLVLTFLIPEELLMPVSNTLDYKTLKTS